MTSTMILLHLRLDIQKKRIHKMNYCTGWFWISSLDMTLKYEKITMICLFLHLDIQMKNMYKLNSCRGGFRSLLIRWKFKIWQIYTFGHSDKEISTKWFVKGNFFYLYNTFIIWKARSLVYFLPLDIQVNKSTKWIFAQCDFLFLV